MTSEDTLIKTYKLLIADRLRDCGLEMLSVGSWDSRVTQIRVRRDAVAIMLGENDMKSTDEMLDAVCRATLLLMEALQRREPQPPRKPRATLESVRQAAEQRAANAISDAIATLQKAQRELAQARQAGEDLL